MQFISLRLQRVMATLLVASVANADQTQEARLRRRQLQSQGAPLVEVHSKKTSDGYEVDVLVREPENKRSNEFPDDTAPLGGSATEQPSKKEQEWRPISNAAIGRQPGRPKSHTPKVLSPIRQASGVQPATQQRPVSIPPIPPAATDEAGTFESVLTVPTAEPKIEPSFLVTGESLEQAFVVAISQSQTLEAMRRLRSASGHEWEAAKSDRWSSTSLRGAYGYHNRQQGLQVPTVPVPGFPTSISTQQRDIARAGIYWEQPLLTFGRIDNAIDAASARMTMAGADELIVEQDVKLKAAQAYVAVLRAKQFVSVEQSDVASLEEHERNVRHRLEQGLVVRNELLSVQTEVLNARQKLLEAENTLDTAHAAYNQALGRPLAQPVNLQNLELPKNASDSSELTQVAMQRRAEFMKLGAEGHALHHQAESTRAGNLPQVSVQASYEYTQNRFATFQDIGTVALVADWNVLDSGRRQNRANQITETAAGVARRRSDLESEVGLQVHETRQNLQTALKRVEVNREALQSADENLAISTNRYREGTVTNSVVLDAVALHTAAYGRFHNSVFDAVLAEIRLKRAIGEL